MQALEYGAKYKQEEHHYAELGIATLNASFINANRDPKKSSPAKPSDFFYFQPPNKDFDAAIANTILSLAANGKLPDWTVTILPLADFIKMKTSEKSSNNPRALVGNAILIINPLISEERIYFPLACLSDAKGKTLVVDVDTGKRYWVYVPEHENNDIMILDDFFQMLR